MSNINGFKLFALALLFVFFQSNACQVMEPGNQNSTLVSEQTEGP